MKNTIDCTMKGLKIFSYEEDIEKLKEISEIYQALNNLQGQFYNDMMKEIAEQIFHCKECIKNLQEEL